MRKTHNNFFKFSECKLNLHSFYTLRMQKQTFHKNKERTSEYVPIEIDFDSIMGDHANQDLQDKLNSVKHFFVDSDSFRGKHMLFNFTIAELNPQLIAEKLQTVFSKIDIAVRINIS